MTEMISRYLDKIKIGAQQSYKNLTMFPLLSNYSIPLQHLTIMEAFSNEMVARDENKRAPKFKAINKSQKMVLILDRKFLAGADQNRSVCRANLIPANNTATNPERCTKQRRSTKTNRKLNYQRDMASWDYIEQFARVDGQNGAIFLINGHITGMVCFGRPADFKVSFIKIVERYAKKAVEEFDPTIALEKKSTAGKSLVIVLGDSRLN